VSIFVGIKYKQIMKIVKMMTLSHLMDVTYVNFNVKMDVNNA